MGLERQALPARELHREAQESNPKFSRATHGMASHILRLQRTIGNRAVQRMLNLEHPNGAATVRVQPQLRVGAMDDPLEREADRVATQGMHTADRTPQAKFACGDTCSKCRTGRATLQTQILAYRRLPISTMRYGPPASRSTRQPERSWNRDSGMI
jgi:hypothetical protein